MSADMESNIDIDEDLNRDSTYSDFLVSAHAVQIRRSFRLPWNVRVVMLCADTTMCACTQASF